MSDNILLNCSILGPDVGRAFSVQVSPKATVDQLKEAIKKKKEHDLSHIDADRLDLWKVSASFQRTSVTNGNTFNSFPVHFQRRPSSRHLGTRGN